ncbi:MAG: class I SAM-dependent methyltransferase [Desulfobacteraceae bacterium]
MTEKKFDVRKLDKLNNPQRLVDISPDYIIDKLNITKADVIADIGAGTALFSIAFYELLNPSAVYALDISDEMLEWVRGNVCTDYPRIIPLKSEENLLPVESETADLAFMINLHHELVNPLLSLREAFRIIKPGGRFFAVDWKKEEMSDGPPQNIRFMAEDAADQIVKAGFMNVSIFNDLRNHFLVTGEKA